MLTPSTKPLSHDTGERTLPAVVASAVVTLVLLSFLSILEPAALTSNSLNAARVAELGLIGLAAIIVSLAIILARCPLVLDPKAVLILVASSVWATLSSLWSVSPLLSFGRGVILVTMVYVALALAVYLRASFTDSVRAFASITTYAMFAAIAILVLLNLVYWGTPLPFTEDSAWSGRPGRLYLAYLVPLETGEFLGLSIIVTMLGLRNSIWKYAALAVLAYLLYLTDARNVMAFVPAALVVALIMRRNLMMRFVVAAAGVCALAALVIFGLAGELDQFVPADLATLNGRTPLWAIAFDQIMQHPFLGVGYFASRFFLGSATTFNAGHTHNAYVETFLNLGIIGLLLLLVFILYCAKRSLEDRSGFLPALLFICLLGSMFNPLILVTNIHSFFLATSLLVVAEQARRQRPHAVERASLPLTLNWEPK